MSARRRRHSWGQAGDRPARRRPSAWSRSRPSSRGRPLVLLVTQGRPIFFRQQRPGLERQALHDRQVPDDALAPARRGLVRDRPPAGDAGSGGSCASTSLDELPELWNVLRGEMSLVGPRPLLVEFLANYTPEEARRHEMRPGVTGWAVVNGRQAASFEDRFRLDVWYVDHWSLGLDARIIGRTSPRSSGEPMRRRLRGCPTSTCRPVWRRGWDPRKTWRCAPTTVPPDRTELHRSGLFHTLPLPSTIRRRHPVSYRRSYLHLSIRQRTYPSRGPARPCARSRRAGEREVSARADSGRASP